MLLAGIVCLWTATSALRWAHALFFCDCNGIEPRADSAEWEELALAASVMDRDETTVRLPQIHGSARFSESNPPHHPWRIGGVGRVEIPDSPQEKGATARPAASPSLSTVRAWEKSAWSRSEGGRRRRRRRDRGLSPKCCEGVACSSTEDGLLHALRGNLGIAQAA